MADNATFTKWYNTESDDRSNVSFTIDYKTETAPASEDGKRPKITIEYTLPDTTTSTQRVSAMHAGTVSVSQIGGGMTTPPNIVKRSYGSFEQRHYAGTFKIKASWITLAGENQEAEEQYDAGVPLNSSATVVENIAEVRLSSRLTSAITPDEEGATQAEWTADSTSPDGRGKLTADILSHLYESLREGTGKYWELEDPVNCCKNGTPYRDVDLNTLNTNQELEECWVQHVAELVTGSSYGGAGPAMGAPQANDDDLKGTDGTHKQDSWVFRKCVINDNPLIPLMMACQQSATFVLICRGHDSLAQNPLDSHSVNIGKLPGKTVVPKSEYGKWTNSSGWISVEKSLEDDKLKPGTCFYFLIDNNPPVLDFPHVAPTLRILRSKKTLNMSDTGAWIFDPKGPLRNSRSGGYNFDTLYKSTLSKSIPPEQGTSSLTGILVPPEPTDLRGAIERMRRARPLGVCRCVISLRSSPTVTQASAVWVSNLLPMYHGGTPFTVAHLISSLRGTPHRNNLNVRWQVFMPSGATTLNEAVIRDNQWWVPRSGYTPVLLPVIELAVDTDGVPRILQRRTQGDGSIAYANFLNTFNHTDFNTTAQTPPYTNRADTTSEQSRISIWFGGSKT